MTAEKRAETLKVHMKDQRHNALTLSKMAGLHQQTVLRILKGNDCMCATLIAIAQALGVSESTLI